MTDSKTATEPFVNKEYFCPFCGAKDVHLLMFTGRFECDSCKKRFRFEELSRE